MARKGSIVWSLKHRPPLSITVIGAILLFLMSSKEQLIDAMPLSNADTKAFLGSWYIYILKLLGVVFALLQLILGLNKDEVVKPPTDYPLRP